jgi:hypothetical protein
MSRRLGLVLTVCLAALAIVPIAQGQATRTWVSGVGDDANPCGRTAPCRTFAGAIGKTATGGIINVLDPGAYGTVTITKSITLTGPPGMGHILASAVTGIIVNGANARVIIRNIDISGAGSPEVSGVRGINFIQGRSLRLENVTIDNFTQHGVFFNSTGNFYANNLSITGAQFGVFMQSIGGPARGTIRNLTVMDGAYGVITHGASTNLTLNDCEMGVLGNGGLYAATSSRVAVNRCTFRDSGFGIFADINALVRVSDSTIVNNSAGVVTSAGGQVLSRGNNTLEDNAAGNTFTGLFGAK